MAKRYNVFMVDNCLELGCYILMVAKNVCRTGSKLDAIAYVLCDADRKIARMSAMGDEHESG